MAHSMKIALNLSMSYTDALAMSESDGGDEDFATENGEEVKRRIFDKLKGMEERERICAEGSIGP